MIQCNNITKDNLQNISFSVNRGETVSILSNSSLDLSLLFNLIFDVSKPTRGDIKINNQFVNKQVKLKTIIGIPRYIWFDNRTTVKNVIRLKQNFYPNLDNKYINNCLKVFNINKKSKWIDLSSDLKTYIYTIISLSANVPVSVCDNIFNLQDEYIKESLIDLIFKRKQNKLTNLILLDNLNCAQTLSDKIYYIDNGSITFVEYMRDRIGVDKVLTIFDREVNVDPFLKLGLILLENTPNKPVKLFYNGLLNNLTKVLYQQNLKDYTLENSSLEHKLQYLRSL